MQEAVGSDRRQVGSIPEWSAVHHATQIVDREGRGAGGGSSASHGHSEGHCRILQSRKLYLLKEG